ncbi:hypothetical protein SAMN04488580_10534 [Mycobacterium sp. 283mftsu]|nr:hypothetical protein SAMN04488580_10534 [Mycobacterium sp. 283mftsu]
MPASHLVWTGLACATDHLNSVRSHLESTELFPFSSLTLSRSALLGAAQAVWILSPTDSATRVKRARIVAAYIYKHRIRYLEGLEKLKQYDPAGTSQQLTHDRVRLADLEAKRLADGQNEILNATNMIDSATKAVFVGRETLHQEALLAWQAGSGAAHGQLWPHFNTGAMKQTEAGDGTGMASFTVGGTFSVMASPYLAAFELAKRGWSLLDYRGSKR